MTPGGPWVSVNLAPDEILAPGLAEHVSATLRDTGLDPRRLVLEISERTTLDAVRRTSATLAQLRALGVRIALDDFGTGSTSLSTLRFLAIEIVKLDKSFIDRISVDPEAHRLAAAVLDLARALGLETVAEGIEHAGSDRAPDPDAVHARPGPPDLQARAGGAARRSCWTRCSASPSPRIALHRGGAMVGRPRSADIPASSQRRGGPVSRARVIVVLAAAVAAVVLVSATAQARPRLDPPKRVMIVVIDQFLPEYVDRFDMENVRAVMDDGVNFRRALVGHMAAETVITHNVLTSGLFPKHMGWSNEVFRDVDNVLGDGEGAYHVTSSLGCGDFETLLTAQGYPKLDDYLGGQFISVGQKPTAVCPAGHPADPEDIIVHIGSRNARLRRRRRAQLAQPRRSQRPGLHQRPDCGRFYVDASSSMTYGTGTTSPAWMYPLDGNRFAVGTTRTTSAATSGPPTPRSS